jgi:hypothetical protein
MLYRNPTVRKAVQDECSYDEDGATAKSWTRVHSNLELLHWPAHKERETSGYYLLEYDDGDVQEHAAEYASIATSTKVSKHCKINHTKY